MTGESQERVLDEADEAEVVARYRQGASEPQLATRFGVSRITIRRTLDRAEEPRRPRGWQQQYDVSDEAVLYLRDDCGMTWHEIATRTGMKLGGARARYFAARRRVSPPTGD